MLRLEGITADAGPSCVLDHVSLTVAASEICVVVGGRGAGKSLLAGIAACAVRPAQGHVWIGERDVLALQSVSYPFVRRNIGFLPENPPFVAEETALENVMLALATRGVSVADADVEARRVLAAVGADFALTGDRGMYTLSVSQLRLVAVARALVGAPPLVVLDGPSVGLADADRAPVAAAIAATAQSGSAVLCVTADEAFALMLTEKGARRGDLVDGHLLGLAPVIALVPPIQTDSAREEKSEGHVIPFRSDRDPGDAQGA